MKTQIKTQAQPQTKLKIAATIGSSKVMMSKWVTTWLKKGRKSPGSTPL